MPYVCYLFTRAATQRNSPTTHYPPFTIPHPPSAIRYPPASSVDKVILRGLQRLLNNAELQQSGIKMLAALLEEDDPDPQLAGFGGGGGGGSGGGAVGSGVGGGWSPKNWTCPTCHVQTPKSKPVCFKCSTPRVFDDTSWGGAGVGAGAIKAEGKGSPGSGAQQLAQIPGGFEWLVQGPDEGNVMVHLKDGPMRNRGWAVGDRPHHTHTSYEYLFEGVKARGEGKKATAIAAYEAAIHADELGQPSEHSAHAHYELGIIYDLDRNLEMANYHLAKAAEAMGGDPPKLPELPDHGQQRKGGGDSDSGDEGEGDGGDGSGKEKFPAPAYKDPIDFLVKSTSTRPGQEDGGQHGGCRSPPIMLNSYDLQIKLISILISI